MAIPDNILPSSISGAPHLAAFDEVMRDALAGIDIGAVLVHLTEQVPESALDVIAEQWGLPGEGYSFASAPVDVKRKLIREAGLLNARRGTIWAIRYLFDVAGMPDIEVVEAGELNADRYYDGTWFYSGVIPYGFVWLWAQYAIKIHINTATIAMSDEFLLTMDFILKAYAPARCKRVGEYTSMAEMSEELIVADTLAINIF